MPAATAPALPDHVELARIRRRAPRRAARPSPPDARLPGRSATRTSARRSGSTATTTTPISRPRWRRTRSGSSADCSPRSRALIWLYSGDSVGEFDLALGLRFCAAGSDVCTDAQRRNVRGGVTVEAFRQAAHRAQEECGLWLRKPERPHAGSHREARSAVGPPNLELGRGEGARRAHVPLRSARRATGPGA